MLEHTSILSLVRRAPVGHTSVNRRATDRLVRLWDSAADKQSIVENITGTSLWDHSFLMVVDDELGHSVIINSGAQAARGIALGDGRIKSLSHLPPEFAKRLHELGLQCRDQKMPALDNSDCGRPKGIPVRRYRMALVPLVQSDVRGFSIYQSASNMLGVFTYL